MVACSNDSGTPDSDNEPLENLPELSVTDVTGTESVSANSSILFKIRVSKASIVDISFDYTVIKVAAEPSVDFTEKPVKPLSLSDLSPQKYRLRS